MLISVNHYVCLVLLSVVRIMLCVCVCICEQCIAKLEAGAECKIGM